MDNFGREAVAAIADFRHALGYRTAKGTARPPRRDNAHQGPEEGRKNGPGNFSLDRRRTLERASRQTGLSFVVDCKERRSFYTAPANVAVERDFHRIDVEGQPPDAEMRSPGLKAT